MCYPYRFHIAERWKRCFSCSNLDPIVYLWQLCIHDMFHAIFIYIVCHHILHAWYSPPHINLISVHSIYHIDSIIWSVSLQIGWNEICTSSSQGYYIKWKYPHVFNCTSILSKAINVLQACILIHCHLKIGAH